MVWRKIGFQIATRVKRSVAMTNRRSMHILGKLHPEVQRFTPEPVNRFPVSDRSSTADPHAETSDMWHRLYKLTRGRGCLSAAGQERRGWPILVGEPAYGEVAIEKLVQAVPRCLRFDKLIKTRANEPLVIQH